MVNTTFKYGVDKNTFRLQTAPGQKLEGILCEKGNMFRVIFQSINLVAIHQ